MRSLRWTEAVPLTHVSLISVEAVTYMILRGSYRTRIWPAVVTSGLHRPSFFISLDRRIRLYSEERMCFCWARPYLNLLPDKG
jgi:hypothetical protein